jgi:hypothetical protein
MKQDLNQVITFLKMIATSTDGEIWANDYEDKPVYIFCLEKNLIELREEQTDSDGWFNPDAYIENYASVTSKGFDLIDLDS